MPQFGIPTKILKLTRMTMTDTAAHVKIWLFCIFSEIMLNLAKIYSYGKS